MKRLKGGAFSGKGFGANDSKGGKENGVLTPWELGLDVSVG